MHNNSAFCSKTFSPQTDFTTGRKIDICKQNLNSKMELAPHPLFMFTQGVFLNKSQPHCTFAWR